MFDFKVDQSLGMSRARLQSDGVEYYVLMGTSDLEPGVLFSLGYVAQVSTNDVQSIWPGLSKVPGVCLVRSDVYRAKDGFAVIDQKTFGS